MFCMGQIVAYEKQRKAKKQLDLKGKCKAITKSGKPCKNVNCKIHKGVKSDGI